MTIQVKDRIIIGEDQYEIRQTPLSSHINFSLMNIYRNKFSSACWRGYVATWQLLDKKLYLIDLKIYPPDPEADFGIHTLFETNDRVFASWFTGVIEIPSGEVFAHTRYGEELYSHRLVCKFKKGRLRRMRMKEIDMKIWEMWIKK